MEGEVRDRHKESDGFGPSNSKQKVATPIKQIYPLKIAFCFHLYVYHLTVFHD